MSLLGKRAGPADPTGDVWTYGPALDAASAEPSPTRPAQTILQGDHSTGLPQPGLWNVALSHPPGQGYCGQPGRWVAAEGPHGEQGLVWAPVPCCSGATNQALSPILTAQPVCWQRPGLTTPSHHHTDSPLSLRKDLGAWPEPGWSPDAGLKEELRSSVSQVAGWPRKDSSVSRTGPQGAD